MKTEYIVVAEQAHPLGPAYSIPQVYMDTVVMYKNNYMYSTRQKNVSKIVQYNTVSFH